jgi:hypothetical protein
MLAQQHAPSAGSAPDAVGEALDRCLADGRGDLWHESLFSVCRELATASVQGRTISIDEASALAGVTGETRQLVETFVSSMTPEAQVAFLDGLR